MEYSLLAQLFIEEVKPGPLSIEVISQIVLLQALETLNQKLLVVTAVMTVVLLFHVDLHAIRGMGNVTWTGEGCT